MTLVIQRVLEAEVEVDGASVARIGRGLLVLVGVASGDGEGDAGKAALKVAELRVFADQEGKMNHDLSQVGGAVLAVSQFTPAGSIERGRRPSFDGAMEPVRARQLFEAFAAGVAARGIPVATGIFAADMRVRLVNEGPVTFVYDTGRAREPQACVSPS